MKESRTKLIKSIWTKKEFSKKLLGKSFQIIISINLIKYLIITNKIIQCNDILIYEEIDFVQFSLKFNGFHISFIRKVYNLLFLTEKLHKNVGISCTKRAKCFQNSRFSLNLFKLFQNHWNFLNISKILSFLTITLKT